MKSGGVWRTGSGLVYKWSVLQLAIYPWLYRSQYCVAESIVNRYTIPSFLSQRKKVWLAVHVTTYNSADINIYINTVPAWNSRSDCIIYLKLAAWTRYVHPQRTWALIACGYASWAPFNSWPQQDEIYIYIYIYIQIWSEKCLWTVFYPLTPELNTWCDVQKTGIKMTVVYGDRYVAVIYTTCLEFWASHYMTGIQDDKHKGVEHFKYDARS